MKQNKLLLKLIPPLLLGVTACTKSEEKKELLPKQEIVSEIKTINGQEYRFEGNKVTQVSSDPDNRALYGVISDAHGEVERATLFAEYFKELGVEGIISLGDMASNEPLRYGRKDTKDDKAEIKAVLEVLAQTNLPIFVIPGNHESKSDYESALRILSERHSNIIDMTKYRIFDGDDADFVSLPGYQTFKIPGRQFIPDDGYWAKPDFIRATGKLREGLDDAVVLIAHGAGKTNTDGKNGPATIYSGKDVGDTTTTEMMKQNNIPFAVVGHIHEAGGLAATHEGEEVKQGEWVKQFTANFGSLETWKYLNGETHDGMGGVFVIKGEQASFHTLQLLNFPGEGLIFQSVFKSPQNLYK